MTDRATLESERAELMALAERIGNAYRRNMNCVISPTEAKKYITALRREAPAPSGVAVPELEPWRNELSEIIGHLGSAITQSVASDDQIIMDHVKAACEIAKIVRRKA